MKSRFVRPPFLSQVGGTLYEHMLLSAMLSLVLIVGVKANGFRVQLTKPFHKAACALPFSQNSTNLSGIDDFRGDYFFLCGGGSESEDEERSFCEAAGGTWDAEAGECILGSAGDHFNYRPPRGNSGRPVGGFSGGTDSF